MGHVLSVILVPLGFALAAITITRFGPRWLRAAAPYLFFATTPLLTTLGLVGVLTGMDADATGVSPLWGLPFYTLFVSCQLSCHGDVIRNKPLPFLLVAINPLYFSTGPIPQLAWTRSTGRNVWRRLRVLQSDFYFGALFAGVLAPTLKQYFSLHASTITADVLVFGVIFELYVYLNFCGYSTVTWGLMRVVGIRAPRNFRQPFGASSVVEYWKRWHVSLSQVLKELFYARNRRRLGLFPTVLMVFTASAVWHGVTLNFVLWGLFHAVMWYASYRLRNWTGTNFALLIFTIVIGRIIFSESDPQALFQKLSSVLLPWHWNPAASEFALPVSIRERLNLLLCAAVPAWEFALTRRGVRDDRYQHLKGPWASACVAAYLCLFLFRSEGGPVYGAR